MRFRMKNPKISIIIPTKNEAEGLLSVISSVKKYASEIIVVDGHSQDGTREICKKTNVGFFTDHGLGKGDGIKLGIKKAKGDIVVIFDGDGSPNAKDIPVLIKTLVKNKADIVITSRRTGGSFDFNLNLEGMVRTAGSDFMAYLVNRRFGTNFSDVLYNFRAFKKSSLKKINVKANGFDIEQEMLVEALTKGLKVIEIPSRENKRAWGKSKLSTFEGIGLLYRLIKQLV